MLVPESACETPKFEALQGNNQLPSVVLRVTRCRFRLLHTRPQRSEWHNLKVPRDKYHTFVWLAVILADR